MPDNCMASFFSVLKKLTAVSSANVCLGFAKTLLIDKRGSPHFLYRGLYFSKQKACK